MSRPEGSFWEAVDALRARNPRYRREAYGFVVAALGATVGDLPAERQDDPERRHLSGASCCAAWCGWRAASSATSRTVFREWGVTRSEDVGAIVFQLVERGQLSARPEDRLEDFRSGPSC